MTHPPGPTSSAPWSPGRPDADAGGLGDGRRSSQARPRPSQIAGFAVALRAKGETVDELIGLIEAMYAAATPISVPGRLLDVVGTGGDRSMSVNISTMAAIVAAGAGATGRQARQPLGVVEVRSADVLEALGIRLDLPPPGWPRSPRRPASPSASRRRFHPALRHAAVPRRELGIATTFNFLGPLANPARPGAQAIGCADGGWRR